MVTVAHLVKKFIEENPFLLEGLSRDLISHGGLAEELKPRIEKELKVKVKESAIVMALRRYSENLKIEDKKTSFKFKGEIILRTNIRDINVVKSNTVLAKIKQLYTIVDYEKGDVLNVIYGNNEIAIVFSDKYRDKFLKILKGEKIITREKDLVSLTLTFDSNKFLTTPGAIFSATRKLAWNNINIYEIVSTMNELTFILHKNDSMKAYSVIQELFE